MNTINPNNNTTLQSYKPTVPTKTTPGAATQSTFSIANPAGSSGKADKVTISSTGMDMSDVLEPPLETGAIPDWLAGYAHDLTNESWIGCPGNYIAPENRKFSNLSSGERDEYFSLLRSHISSLYEKNGLTNDIAKYEALNSKKANEKLHQDFISGIKSDPRFFELVSKLGIPLS